MIIVFDGGNSDHVRDHKLLFLSDINTNHQYLEDEKITTELSLPASIKHTEETWVMMKMRNLLEMYIQLQLLASYPLHSYLAKLKFYAICMSLG